VAPRHPVGIVTGLEAEARIARRFGVPVEVGGGRAAGAVAASQRLVERGVAGLVSFGLAGGLNPALAAGTVLVPAAVLLDSERWDADDALLQRLGGTTPGVLYGGGEVVASAAAKAALFARTGAVAVDLESAAVARIARQHGLPFAVLRAVCDGAGRALPRAALVALDGAGRIGRLRVAWAAVSRPWEIPDLLRLGGDAARARHALVARVRAIGRL
jgi:adenosylhomocysteine nucleosidase